MINIDDYTTIRPNIVRDFETGLPYKFKRMWIRNTQTNKIVNIELPQYDYQFQLVIDRTMPEYIYTIDEEDNILLNIPYGEYEYELYNRDEDCPDDYSEGEKFVNYYGMMVFSRPISDNNIYNEDRDDVIYGE